MKDVLFNLALIDTTQFCLKNGIDCAGSHLEKAGRGFNYSLIKDETGKVLVTVTFSKYQVPIHRLW